MLTNAHDRRGNVDASPMIASASTADIIAQERLVSALRDAAASATGGESVAVIETHISHVLLTGPFAYKIKKPVDLGFLDFRTLAARRFYCEEELRLNRRLAPELYLDVVAITGSVAAPALNGSGPAIEYAVKMREFPQDALASRTLARGELSGALIDALAAQVAGFHRGAAVARAEGWFGAPDTILRLALQNFHQLRPLLADPADSKALDQLAEWTRAEHATCAQAMARRREQGFIRECHGDLHLGNIAILENEPIIFDCIEFNEEMRWIDVMSEVAFTVMDLKERGRTDLAQRFLNAYLEISGDYDGLSVLRYYLVYRAMVRAKVSRLRAGQLAKRDASAALGAEYDGYVRLAKNYALTLRPALVITHGLAGSGKTTLSQALLEMIGAVRIRIDVERKRLHGLIATARGRAGIDAGLYALEATREAYRRALELARGATAAGYVAIVDATFLRHWQRQLFRDLATELGLPFVIVTFVTSEATLRERIVKRLNDACDASDADLAVLEHQLQTQEPLAPDELADMVAYDAEAPLDDAQSRARWQAVLDRLAPEPSISAAVVAAAPEAVDARLAAKVAFLSRPESYPEPTVAVHAVETHMSWVFLTERHAYKLKKPVCFSYLDFRTVASRRHYCDEEVRLNRRLSDGVYLGTIPLTVDVEGRLRLGSGDGIVDWLVHMRRLPADRMLDEVIRNRALQDDDMQRVLAKLCRFYRQAPAVAMTPAAYHARLAAGIAENKRELCNPAYALPRDLVEATCERQRAVLDRHAALFDQRVLAGRVIEAHGDLRPEHICLEREPQIIDSLEFSLGFRRLDSADELAFLALECERLGVPELRRCIFGAYAGLSGDTPSETLVHFYQSHRACTRATIAVWHLNDAVVRDPRKWIVRAREYLRLAREHIDRCA